MRPTGTTHSTGLHGRALHGTWLRPAALGARCMALGCDEGPGLASWLQCRGISSAWCLRYAGINTPVCVAPKVKGRHTEKELERKLVD